MKIKVSLNRMNLLKLRKRLRFAIRGHKLLKDKQEQLTKEFNNLIFNLIDLRKELNENLFDLYSYVKILHIYYPKEYILELFTKIFDILKLNLESRNISKYNLKYKEFFLNTNINYFILISDPYLNIIIKKIINLYQLILKLSNLETFCELVAKELKIIRRRVNALEYILIPQIKFNIKTILNKLNEIERTSITQLMRIKQII